MQARPSTGPRWALWSVVVGCILVLAGLPVDGTPPAGAGSGERIRSQQAPLAGPGVARPLRCAAFTRRTVSSARRIARTRTALARARTRVAVRTARVRLARELRVRASLLRARRAACRTVPGQLPPSDGSTSGVPAGPPSAPAAAGPTTPVTSTPPVIPPPPVTPGPPTPPPPVPGPGQRALADRPDQISGSQVHLVYVVPADGPDRRLDTTGAVADSFAAAQRWLVAAAGVRLRLDTYQGSPDISFHRLRETNAEAAAEGAFVREVIERSLIGAGFDRPGTILLVYYDGLNTTACGSGAWPPALPGTVGALYLKGEPPGFSCGSVPLARAGAPPGYWEHSLVHEAFHLMGHVPACAPNQHAGGHVSDSPADIMYAGPEAWTPSAVDVGSDDYFGAGIPGCPDLARSPYLTRAG